MIRAGCVACGLVMLLTGQTPLDWAGVQWSAHGGLEMAVSVLALMVVMIAAE